MADPQIVQIHSAIYDFFYSLYPELKFWIGFATAVIFGYKGYQWVKSIKTNDLLHIHESVKSLETSMQIQTKALQESLEKQTNTFVGEMKELRADFRGLTNAFIVPPRRKRQVKK